MQFLAHWECYETKPYFGTFILYSFMQLGVISVHQLGSKHHVINISFKLINVHTQVMIMESWYIKEV